MLNKKKNNWELWVSGLCFLTIIVLIGVSPNGLIFSKIDKPQYTITQEVCHNETHTEDITVFGSSSYLTNFQNPYIKSIMFENFHNADYFAESICLRILKDKEIYPLSVHIFGINGDSGEFYLRKLLLSNHYPGETIILRDLECRYEAQENCSNKDYCFLEDGKISLDNLRITFPDMNETKVSLKYIENLQTWVLFNWDIYWSYRVVISENKSEEVCEQQEVNLIENIDMKYAVTGLIKNISIDKTYFLINLSTTSNRQAIGISDDNQYYNYGYCIEIDGEKVEFTIYDSKPNIKNCYFEKFNITSYEGIVNIETISKEDLTREWLDENCGCIKYKDEDFNERLNWIKKCEKLEEFEKCFHERYIFGIAEEGNFLCNTNYCEIDCVQYKCGNYTVEVKK